MDAFETFGVLSQGDEDLFSVHILLTL
jgi:hypothetical protein